MPLRKTYSALLQRLEHLPFVRLFVSQVTWSIFGSLLANGTSLITTMFVARLLGRSPFGQYVTLQTTMVTLATLVWYGISITAMRYSAELRQSDPARLSRILSLCQDSVLALSAAVAGILAAGSVWISARFYHAPELAGLLALTAIAIFFTALDSFQKNVQIGFGAMRSFAIGSALGAVVMFPIVLGLAWAFGLLGGTIGLVIGAAINCAISRFQMKTMLASTNISFTRSGSMAELRNLMRYGLPNQVAGIMPSAANWTVQSMLATLGGGFSEVAVFGVATQWYHIVNFIPATAIRALMPMLTHSISSDEHKQKNLLLLLSIAISFFAALPVALAAAWFAPHILASYGPQFTGSDHTLAIFMGVAVLYAAQAPYQSLLVAKSHMWVSTAMIIVQALIFILVSYWLIDRGAYGTGLALALSYGIQVLLVFAHIIWDRKSGD